MPNWAKCNKISINLPQVNPTFRPQILVMHKKMVSSKRYKAVVMLQNHRSVLSGTSGRSNSGQGGGFTAVLVDRSTHHELEPIQYIAKFIRRLGQVGIPVFLRHTTDDTIVIFGPGKVLEQPDFISPGPPLHFGPGEALFPQPPVDPGDKEHVAGPCLDGAGPGKEIFREGIPDRPHTHLIPCLLLLVQPEHIQNLPPVILCKINPAEMGRHVLPTPQIRRQSLFAYRLNCILT